jgi:NurA-like 5'-3' nuclease
LEFNVYDLFEFRPLVESGMPLEIYNQRMKGWEKTYVAQEEDGIYIGTQTCIVDADIEKLITPIVDEIHFLSIASFISPGYPIVLADAHNRCKITRDRKDRLNAQLIGELQRQGYHPVDFETWSEDPHKIYER